MKISVITVSYNSAETIGQTIDSVLSQRFRDFEYIIIDGASTDETVNIIREKESLFSGSLSWISEPDKGIYDAMNKGIAMARGEIIGILNSDDFYKSSQVLSTVNNSFGKENCDAVYGDIEFISPDDHHRIRYWKSSPYVPGGFLHGWHLPHPSFFVKREVYEKFGVFDTNFGVSADFELMLRLIEKQQIKVEYIPETLVLMTYGGESTGSIRNIIKGNLSILRAFKKHNFRVNPLSYLTARFVGKLKQFNTQTA